jgi:hypothetical protein
MNKRRKPHPRYETARRLQKPAYYALILGTQTRIKRLAAGRALKEKLANILEAESAPVQKE